MAYADAIRAATADLDDVADLIDGTFLTAGSYAGLNIGPQTTTSDSYANLIQDDTEYLSLTITVPANSKVLVCASVMLSHSTAGKYILAGLSEDSEDTISGQPAVYKEHTNDTTGYRCSIPIFHTFSPAAGSHTYRVLWLTDAATAYCYGGHMEALCFRA